MRQASQFVNRQPSNHLAPALAESAATVAPALGDRPPSELIAESESAWFTLEGLEVTFGIDDRDGTMSVRAPGGGTLHATRTR